MKRTVFIFFLLTVIFFSCKNDKKSESKDTVTEKVIEGKKVLGYIYTTTNGEGENQVVQLARYADGSLGDEKIYPTKGKGGSNHDAPAHGDYDGQGSLKIIGDYLLTTNPGDNTVSVFNVDKTNGNLKFNSIVSSEGKFPLTLDFYPADDTKKNIGLRWGTNGYANSIVRW